MNRGRVKMLKNGCNINQLVSLLCCWGRREAELSDAPSDSHPQGDVLRQRDEERGLGGVLDCPPSRHVEWGTLSVRRGDRRTMTRFRHKGLFVLQKPWIKTAVSSQERWQHKMSARQCRHMRKRGTLWRDAHTYLDMETWDFIFSVSSYLMSALLLILTSSPSTIK